MKRRGFLQGAALAAVPFPATATPSVPDDMRKLIKAQGWTCIDESLPPEGVLISMVRADGKMGMFIGAARRHGDQYHCQTSEGAPLGIESAPHGWAPYPAAIHMKSRTDGTFHMVCSDQGVPYSLADDHSAEIAAPR